MAYLPEPQNTVWQQGTTIDLSKTALLVVDVLGGDEGVIPLLGEMAQNCICLVSAARKAGVPVIFSCDAHVPAYDREIELWGEHGIAGTEAAKPLSEFHVQDNDIIIPKRRYDGFFETDLDLTLRELGVDTLIVCGADTNICVLQTLAGAYFRCYKTVVAADACATFLIGTQEDGLAYFSRCYDSRVVDTDTALDYLKQS